MSKAVKPYSLTLLSQLSCAGVGDASTDELLFSSTSPSLLSKQEFYAPYGDLFVGPVSVELPELPNHLKDFNSRVSQIALYLLQSASRELASLLEHVLPNRIGIVIGSSTSGIGAAEEAYVEKLQTGNFPKSYSYFQQEMGALPLFMAEYLGITGPALTVSTACSSSPKALAAGRALMESGYCDAVITGGVDSLCKLTVGGFSSLEIVSSELTNPFSKNRSGLNIGEGGALFLLSKKESSSIFLRGVGESSDAYHVSSPHPEGRGAKTAILEALQEADVAAKDVGYMNLHGTGTKINDAMESAAVNGTLGEEVSCSSTKPITGHALGAAGALELAFCYRALQTGKTPVHRFDGEYDPELPSVRLVTESCGLDSSKLALSNSFAFGGSNCCIAIGTL